MSENNRSPAQADRPRKADDPANRSGQAVEKSQADKTEQSSRNADADEAADASTSAGESQNRTDQPAEQSETAGDRPANAADNPADDATEAAKLAVAAVMIAANNAADAEAVGETEAEDGQPGSRAASLAVINASVPVRGSRSTETADKPLGQGLSAPSANTPLSADADKKPITQLAQSGTVQTIQAQSTELASALQLSPAAASRQDQAGANLQSLMSPFATPSARPDSAGVTTMQVSTPAGQYAWADDVANRVMWLAGRGEGRAELVLTPPSLGKLGVSIQMNGDQATAHFVTASNAARDAIEQAMPRLREALLQAGISMGDSSVSTSGQQQAKDDGRPEHGNSSRLAGGSEYGMLSNVSDEAAPVRFVQVGNGLVDIFA